MKGSTKLWLVVALFAVVALIQFWIVPNWGVQSFRVNVYGYSGFYALCWVMFTGLGYEAFKRDKMQWAVNFIEYSPLYVIWQILKQINKLADKHIK